VGSEAVQRPNDGGDGRGTVADAYPSTAVLVIKRTFDILVGGIGLVFFIVTYPVIALLIKLDSPGPVLFKQERVGMNRRTSRRGEAEPVNVNYGGKPFTIYKYRTMRVDAEEAGPMLAVNGDPRSTRVGGVLRKLHIDEIPQFLNVIRGEMSIIGPRPERPHFTVQYDAAIPHYDRRTLHIKPGLSGLSQVTLGYDDSLESVMRKHDYDLIYWTSLCDFRSFVRMEFWILANTVVYFTASLVPSSWAKRERTWHIPPLTPGPSTSLATENGNGHMTHAGTNGHVTHTGDGNVVHANGHSSTNGHAIHQDGEVSSTTPLQPAAPSAGTSTDAAAAAAG